MSILGIHHITLASADAQRTINFYTKVLGQRFVKQTINFDDPTSYHLYFGDELGRPGTAITFFEWRGAPRGRRGIGGTHHFALRVQSYQGLLKWKRRLTDLGIKVNGPLNRNYFQSIYFNDPDGVILEIATDSPGFLIDESPEVLGSTFQAPPADMVLANRDEAAVDAETWPTPVDVITGDMALLNGMHHITAISDNIERTHKFYGELLGMQRVKQTDNFDHAGSAHWYWGVENGKPGTIITYFERHERDTQYSQMGTGHTHHFALAVADEDEQLRWREKLVKAGLPVSPVMNRTYFKSIYTRDPNGHIVELATLGPGFAVDEDPATLGQTLQIPAMHAHMTSFIQSNLVPLVVPAWVPPQEVVNE